MKLSIISKSDISSSTWDGGKTYEYFIYPKTSSYSQKNFIFRISSATIEKQPSIFTQFDGYKRYLVMLDNDLKIQRNGSDETYSNNEIFEFNSADIIHSFSTGNDFNLMVKMDEDDFDIKVIQLKGDYRQSFIFAFAIEAVQLTLNQTEVKLDKDDLLIIENVNNEIITCVSNRKMIVGYR